MKKKAKPAAAKPKSKHLLAGKYFHSLEADRETIKWQGIVIDEAAPGIVLVQLFDWIAGGDSNQVLVPVADMAYWRIYESSEEMNEAHQDYARRRRAKVE